MGNKRLLIEWFDKMLYLLGGAARSGKSIITRQILAKKGISFFCLDHLAHGVANSTPQLHVDLNSDDASVGEQIWPLVKATAKMIIKDRIDYLLEGASLQPKHANELISEFPNEVRAVFIGYADADIGEKFKQIKTYGGGADDWMMKFDDVVIKSEVERLKVVSKVLQGECVKFQIRYIEMSQDFDKSTKEVIEYLAS